MKIKDVTTVKDYAVKLVQIFSAIRKAGLWNKPVRIIVSTNEGKIQATTCAKCNQHAQIRSQANISGKIQVQTVFPIHQLHMLAINPRCLDKKACSLRQRNNGTIEIPNAVQVNQILGK